MVRCTRLLIDAGLVAVSTCLLAGLPTKCLSADVTSSAAAPTIPPIKRTQLMEHPLTGDASRNVKILSVVLSPGADTGFHHHPGDQYTLCEEGEIHIYYKDGKTLVLKTGEMSHVDPTVVHRHVNEGDKPARSTEFFIVDSAKPLTTKDD